MNPFRWALAAVVAAIIVVGVAVAIHPPGPDEASPLSGQAPASRLIALEGDRPGAPDFTGIDAWLNSRPLGIADLRGKVVLIDFWTYSCVNCTRTVPHLQDLYRREHGNGLEIVGVHSPEFDFEKSRDNVAAAVRRLGVTWPVALDSEMATWAAYQNQYWPAEYLIDRQGRVAYSHFGEGEYQRTDAAVAALLGQSGGAAPPPTDAPPATAITPELYAGSRRGHLAGQAYGGAGVRVDYPDQVPSARDAIGLSGPWSDHGDWVESGGAGHVRLRFHAAELFVVAASSSGSPLPLGVSLDGAGVPGGERGPDLTGSELSVAGPDLRHLLTGLPPGDHLLDLRVPAGVRLYTFTFG